MNVEIKNVEQKERKKKTLKNDKYKEERDETFVYMKKLIKYNEEDMCFTSDDITEDVIKEIKEKIFKMAQKFFSFVVWHRIKIDEKKSHLALIKNIFKDFGFIIINKKKIQNIEGEKKITYKYYVLKDN